LQTRQKGQKDERTKAAEGRTKKEGKQEKKGVKIKKSKQRDGQITSFSDGEKDEREKKKIHKKRKGGGLNAPVRSFGICKTKLKSRRRKWGGKKELEAVPGQRKNSKR